MLFKRMFLFSIFISNFASAGEVLTKGTVLEKDIYAFDQKEATDLMERIEELEHKERLLSLYMDLDTLSEETISAYKDGIRIRDREIKKHDELTLLQDKRIKDLEKQRKRHNVEKYVFLFIGVGLTAGSVIAYDSLKN